MFKLNSEIRLTKDQILQVRDTLNSAYGWNEYVENEKEICETLNMIEKKIWEARCRENKKLAEIRRTLKDIQKVAETYDEYLSDNDFCFNNESIKKLEDLVQRLKRENKND